MLDPIGDGDFEFVDIGEDAAADALPGDFCKEPLDEIEPRTGRWREVQGEAFVPREPAFHGWCLVGGVIVEDQMQIEMIWGLAVDRFEERQEFACPVAGEAFTDDGARRDIECRKQRCGAVALVVMGHGSGPTLLQGQARLGAVEGLDLAFLVDRKHERLDRKSVV